jgi:hypothetical protein
MRRKDTKQSRGANKAEKAFLSWLKEQPCCITGEYGVHVHHCVGSSVKKDKVHIGHYFCIPLTPDKHLELHARKKAFREEYGSQGLCWVMLCSQYYDDTGVLIPSEVEIAILSTHT